MKILFSLLLLSLFSFVKAQEKPEGLFINSKAPDFKAKDQDGKDVVLKDIRKKGNIVLVFYRGSWCPHCSRYLKQLQDSFESFKAKGAQIIIVTPQGDEGIDSAVAKSGATFPVIHDKDMKIANNYKVAYKVDDRTLGRYKNAGIDLLKENNQVKDAWLPVPAVYIINTEGSITFRYFEEDYKKRLPIADIVKALNGGK
ncbi:MAG: peroxiredoxin family protein [Flavisolibacter sp.]